jgi:hypothetical protein
MHAFQKCPCKVQNLNRFIALESWNQEFMLLLIFESVPGTEAATNGSTPDCKSVVLGSNPAPPQFTANSVSPEVGSHLG